jgi:hypothetical protein
LISTSWIRRHFLFSTAIAALIGDLNATAQEPAAENITQEQIDFFENRIRPIFVEHCYECHSGGSKSIQAKLRLNSRELAIHGGESGPAILPGNPQESLLVSAVSWKGLEMPPDRKLKEDQIADLTKWVQIGAPWGRESEDSDAAQGMSIPQNTPYDWNKWRSEHWAFQPIGQIESPKVADLSWCKTPIDEFVLESLRANGLQPAKSEFVST